MERITNKQLDRMCKKLNELMGNPLEAYVQNHWGDLIPQAGHIGYNTMTGCSYGGTEIVVMRPGGGESNVGSGIRGTKKDAYKQLQAMIDVMTMTQRKSGKVIISAEDVAMWGANTKELYIEIYTNICKTNTEEAWVGMFELCEMDYVNKFHPDTTYEVDRCPRTGAAMLRAHFKEV